MSSFGQLLSKEEIATSLTGARAWKITYASADVNDAPTVSSGLVIAPSTTGTDRPVLTWAHGTTGLGDAACPSAQPDPARELIVYFSIEATQSIDYGVPGLQGFIDDGWVVCASDHQGLGTPGMHQYTVNRTNARDVVGIVHAARAMDVGAGTLMGCMGWSQGGGTAAAVAELDPSDYGDLTLIGTVAMSPAVPSIALADPTGLASAFAGGDSAPDSHLVMLLAGYAAAFPNLKLSDMLTPLGVSIVEGAYNTQPVHHLNDTIARLFRLKGPILAINQAAMPAWKQAFDAGSAGQRKPVCPVFMCTDGLGGGLVVSDAWQASYADTITKLGGTITTKTYPNDDHFSLPFTCLPDAKAWITAQLTAAEDPTSDKP